MLPSRLLANNKFICKEEMDICWTFALIPEVFFRHEERREREKQWKKTSVSWYVKCQLTSRDRLTSNQWQHTCQLPQPIPVCYKVPRKIKKTVTCYQRFFLTTSLFLFFSRRKKTSGPRVQLLLFICNTCSWAEFCPVSLATVVPPAVLT